MRTRALPKAAQALVVLAASILFWAPSPARAAGGADVGLASLGASPEPSMCPAKSARQAESQIFSLQQQLAAQLPPQPSEPGFQVLNTRGANYATGQRLADPAILHVEGLLPH